MTGFDRLHPALQHHVVNSLGWSTLRPLQEEAISPVLDGGNALLLAPTAGGKTEAAIFPLLSRMLSEDWRGIGVVYVCPIKALLNNLHVRLEHYAGLLGRRVALWHGDVGTAERRRIVREPPDILLTTPESLEVMLIFRQAEREALFGGLQAVVVDEIHAFAGDDRGWHLLSVLERIKRIAGRDIQRIGLSATIGNPDELLVWLAGSSEGDRHVVAPSAMGDPADVDARLDFVGSLKNAAIVIHRLHRGEKRLVFCDSRSRVERLATELRQLGVRTFVSHSSLGVDERRQAERAFAEGEDCVIVATSTLELGIDVGDLDRVIQIDAPTTVASFLQRLGRTGRRPGTVRNCLFLATTEDAFHQAAGLIHLWRQGFVEPVRAPRSPLHILAQQLMALTLQEGAVGRNTWLEWVEGMPAFREVHPETVADVVGYMLQEGILFEEEGLLSMGAEGEGSFGRKNFLDLCSVFTSEPLFTVMHGRTEIGRVHQVSFQAKTGGQAILSLAGRSWRVTHVDWDRRLAYAEASALKGRSSWLGSPQPLHFELCQAMRDVVAVDGVELPLTERGQDELESLRAGFAWVREEDETCLVVNRGSISWWTFAGLRANLTLAHLLEKTLGGSPEADNLAVHLPEDARVDGVLQRIGEIRNHPDWWGESPVNEEALKGLKFSVCLPPERATSMLRKRMAAPSAVERAVCVPARTLVVAEEGQA